MWKVYVTDNQGAEHLIFVRAKGEADALDKSKQFFRKRAPKGVWAVSAPSYPRRRKASSASSGRASNSR